MDWLWNEESRSRGRGGSGSVSGSRTRGQVRNQKASLCVLPAPVGPTIAVVVPAATVKLTRLSPFKNEIRRLKKKRTR